MEWRSLLPEILQAGSYRTQREIVRALAARTGTTVNQATVSRELSALGARKVDGVYQMPDELEAAAPVHDLHVTAGGCLVVIHTDPAFAPVLGHVIDEAAIPGVLGNIAGDDTVFVATAGPDATEALETLLGRRRA